MKVRAALGVGVTAVTLVTWLTPTCHSSTVLLTDDPDLTQIFDTFNLTTIKYALARDALAITGFISLSIAVYIAFDDTYGRQPISDDTTDTDDDSDNGDDADDNMNNNDITDDDNNNKRFFDERDEYNHYQTLNYHHQDYRSDTNPSIGKYPRPSSVSYQLHQHQSSNPSTSSYTHPYQNPHQHHKHPRSLTNPSHQSIIIPQHPSPTPHATPSLFSNNIARLIHSQGKRSISDEVVRKAREATAMMMEMLVDDEEDLVDSSKMQVDEVEKPVLDDVVDGDMIQTTDEAVMEGTVSEMNVTTQVKMDESQMDESQQSPDNIIIQPTVLHLFEQVIVKLDSHGCMLKLLCHLNTLPQVNQQQQTLLLLFSKSPSVLKAYSDAYLTAKELMELEGEETTTNESPLSCQQIFSRCHLKGNELRNLVDRLWGV
ncbi:hypothetical protein Pmani_019827 [Petrolisthes manimaculis]|uniref:Uncharacterized protein n=1 Tax=Petrolisthes manimaculis TaxID=1843537 RepID=A0AAE1PJL3_9EUCA|nr:hypothetical protein Pmani_019827 [Petrolisthes manimaculis]